MDSLDVKIDADDVVLVIGCDSAAFSVESLESTDFAGCVVDWGLEVWELDCFRVEPESGESLLEDDAGFG